jgi:hypothetical protein
MQTAKLLTQDIKTWEIALTATTNKAVEALAGITNEEVTTIQSKLGLRVVKNYEKRTSMLVPKDTEIVEDTILFIDEASFIDADLLALIFERTHNCKIVFIGDPAQITPINSNKTPVFSAGFDEAKLTEVVRQAEGNPIIDLATAFRGTVNTGVWFAFTPDGTNIYHAPRAEFEELISAEFSRPEWSYMDSKVLAWTNKTVINYNQGIRNHVQGNPELQVGDYAVCNSFIGTRKYSIKTDELVHITSINPATEVGIDGWIVEVNNKHSGFLPREQAEAKARSKVAKAAGELGLVRKIDEEWFDLRAAYACTVNKAQGSTFERVFIDLDDIGKCHNGNQIARMMYVAVSRASKQVFMTGDLV